jgi:predicted GNAT family acetyltransferase
MSNPAVVVNDDLDRFETTVDGQTAFLTFRRDGRKLVLDHTEVPSSLEGHGVGGAIVRAALEYARANDLTVVPECAFVKSFLKHHPDEAARIKLDMSAT